MKLEKKIQIVIAFLIFGCFISLVLSNILEVEPAKTTPGGSKPEPPASKSADSPSASTVSEVSDNGSGINPVIIKQWDRLSDAELRLLKDLPEAEKELKLSDMQKHKVRSLVHESMAEMNAAAADSGKKNDPAIFDKALEKVEAEAKTRLKETLTPDQLEKLRRMAEKEAESR